MSNSCVKLYKIRTIYIQHKKGLNESLRALNLSNKYCMSTEYAQLNEHRVK